MADVDSEANDPLLQAGSGGSSLRRGSSFAPGLAVVEESPGPASKSQPASDSGTSKELAPVHLFSDEATKKEGPNISRTLTKAYNVQGDGGGLRDAAEEPLEPLTKQKIDWIRWDPTTFHDRRSPVVYIPDNSMDPPPMFDNGAEWAVKQLDLPTWLEKTQEYSGGVKGVIAITGDDDGLHDFLMGRPGEKPLPEGLTSSDAIVRIRLLFGRGIARGALETKSVVITSGLDVGMGGFAGRSNRDRYHTVPLVAVVGRGNVTWPGDSRKGDGGDEHRVPLQPDHTHLIMIDNYRHDYESVWRYRVEVCKQVASGMVNVKPDTEVEPADLTGLPRVVYVLNGKQTALMEVLMFVRMGWPVCLIRGTGGVADEIADAMDDPYLDEHIPDPYMLEIIKEGTLEVVNLGDVDGSVVRQLTERLFGMPGEKADRISKEVVLAWDLVETYMKTEREYARFDNFIFFGLVGNSIVIQFLLIFTYIFFVWLEFGVIADSPGANDLFDGCVLACIVLPIIGTVLVLIENRFKPGSNQQVLYTAQMSLVSEIYKFRSGCSIYLGKATADLDDIFATVMSRIRLNVLSSSVGEISLRHKEPTDAKTINTTKPRRWDVPDCCLLQKDNGCTKLTPEQYIASRLHPLLKFYSDMATKMESSRKVQFVLENLFTALGILLVSIPLINGAGFGPVAFMNATILVTMSIRTVAEKKMLEIRLAAYNRAACGLWNALAWWKSLSNLEMTNPQKYNDLVGKVEMCVLIELQSTNPGAASIVMSFGDGGGGGEPDPTKLNAEALLTDINDNIDQGKIRFDVWIKKHPVFFEGYNKWLAARIEPELEAEIKHLDLIERLSRQGSRPGGGGLGGDAGGGALTMAGYRIMEKDIAEQPLPEYEGVSIADAQGRLQSISWNPYDFRQRSTRVIPVPSINMTPEHVWEALQLDAWLEVHQRWDRGVRSLMLAVGSSDSLDHFLDQAPGSEPMAGDATQARMRLQLLASRGICRAGIEARSACLTYGLDFGIAKIIGHGNRDRRYKLPLIGVVGKGLVTWPGDTRPERHHELHPLNPDHTHQIMLHTEDDLPGVRRYAFEFATMMMKRLSLPGVVILVNGREQELLEVLKYVRQGLPVIVIRGTGGAADAVVGGMKMEDQFIMNSRILEAVKEGVLDSIDISDIDGSLFREMLLRAFQGMKGGSSLMGKENMILAWELIYLYNNVAWRNYWDDYYIVGSILVLSMLAALPVNLIGEKGFREWVADADERFDPDVDTGVSDPLVGLVCFIPTALGILYAVSARFRFQQQCRIFWCAAEAIKSQVYMYRSQMMDYARVSEYQRDDLLAANIKIITQGVVGSLSGETALILKSLRGPQKKEYEQSPDDDGLSVLTPDEYISVRVLTELADFKAQSIMLNRFIHIAQISNYILGGTCVLLAAYNQFPFAVLTNLLQFCIVALDKHSGIVARLTFVNRAITDLENLESGWRALSSIETANPAKFNQAVQMLEGVKKAEIISQSPGGGGGGGGGDDGIIGLDLLQLKQDLAENLLKNGKIRWRESWVTKHKVLFDMYERWLYKQGFKRDQMGKVRVKMEKRDAKDKIQAEVEGYNMDERIEEFVDNMKKMAEESGEPLSEEDLQRYRGEVKEMLRSTQVGGKVIAMIGEHEQVAAQHTDIDSNFLAASSVWHEGDEDDD